MLSRLSTRLSDAEDKAPYAIFRGAAFTGIPKICKGAFALHLQTEDDRICKNTRFQPNKAHIIYSGLHHLLKKVVDQDCVLGKDFAALRNVCFTFDPNPVSYTHLYKMETVGRRAYGWKERPGAVLYQIQ